MEEIWVKGRVKVNRKQRGVSFVSNLSSLDLFHFSFVLHFEGGLAQAIAN